MYEALRLCKRFSGQPIVPNQSTTRCIHHQQKEDLREGSYIYWPGSHDLFIRLEKANVVGSADMAALHRDGRTT